MGKSTREVLTLALEILDKKKNGEELHNVLRVGLTSCQLVGIIQMIHDEIEDQYYEYPPSRETQEFLNKIKFIRDNYHRYTMDGGPN